MDAAMFEKAFGLPPQALGKAPGRVNLLGEHTDYNDGYVLPIAVPLETSVHLARSLDDLNHYFASDLQERAWSEPGGTVPSGFASYLHGCLSLLRLSGFHVDPVSVLVSSQVPMDSGLSSSAALEVAFLRGMRQLFALDMDDVEIALMAQQAEIRYAGVNCGIMDQMAVSLADARHMLLLDTKSLERKVLPLPQGCELLVIDSGMPRHAWGEIYNLRREECEEAARRLGLATLRDLEDASELTRLPCELAKRARHFITENQRVLEAAAGVEPSRFGALMRASHESLRDDLQASTPELDTLVGLLEEQPDVFGARPTGAGFGGACVALAREENAAAVAGKVLERYRARGLQGRLLVPR